MLSVTKIGLLIATLVAIAIISVVFSDLIPQLTDFIKNLFSGFQP